MSQIGFVYILVNDYMPDVYKVGCTERSPHERAAELSKGTGVPDPFKVLCYIEIENFQAAEKEVHAWLGNRRISPSREFFYQDIEYVARLLYWHPRRLSFCAPRPPAWRALSLWDGAKEPCAGLPESVNPFQKSRTDYEEFGTATPRVIETQIITAAANSAEEPF